MTAAEFRAGFGFFRQRPDWVYLDNAATSHKPDAVIDAISQFYRCHNANVHRSGHGIADEATALFEQARHTVLQFLGAGPDHQLIWTSGATEALNLLAAGLSDSYLQPGDRVLLTMLEHHANIVPWQFYAERRGIILDVVPLDAEYRLDLSAYQQLLARQPKVVSFCHASNGLGHINAVRQMVQQAKAAGALTIVDGSQGVTLGPPDVSTLGCDVYLFSGHKLYGPTGIGALCGTLTALELLQPLRYGGEMIKQVSFSGTSLNTLPYRLEAGTPHVAGAIGLAAAINYLRQFDLARLAAHKQQLLQQLWHGCAAIDGVRLLSQLQDNCGIISLVLPGEHPADLATLLNQQQIAVRAGTHCAMPLFADLQLPGAVRFSLAPYNTSDEISQALLALACAVDMFV